MSDQQQFPDAWGTFMRPLNLDGIQLDAYWSSISDKKPGSVTSRRAEIVRLIPEQEVDRLVREAEQRGRDAERERCRLCAVKVQGHAIKANSNIAFVTAKFIRDAIDSGEQPGECTSDRERIVTEVFGETFFPDSFVGSGEQPVEGAT
jgi:hypothetical protein